MGNMNKIEVEVDDRGYSMLKREGERLGIDISQVVHRAVAAWITDIANDCPPLPDSDPSAHQSGTSDYAGGGKAAPKKGVSKAVAGKSATSKAAGKKAAGKAASDKSVTGKPSAKKPKASPKG